DIIEVAAQHQELTGGIVVTENGTLKADMGMSMSVVAASSKGTVQIDSGVVVTAAGGTQTVKLTGTGTYALANGVQTLGSVNADNFSGAVRLSGGINNIDLDGNLQGHTVELNGVSNFFKNLDEGSNATFTGDIILTNAGETAAITINNGYSRKTSTYIFSGDISGEGTWALTKNTITQHYEFRGDLSGWSGEIKVSGGRSGNNQDGWYNTSLVFSHENGEVGAAITRTGGYLDLNINENTTFANTVTNVTNVIVADGKTATFNQNASMAALSGEGDIIANEDLGIGATDAYAGTVSVTGTLLVSGAVDLGDRLDASGNIVVGTGASLMLTAGSTIGSQAIQNSGSVSLTGLDVSAMEKQDGEDAHFDLAGQVTEGDNYYKGNTGDYVQVVDGGTSTGTGLTWNAFADQTLVDGKIIVGQDQVIYDTYFVGGETSVEDITNGEHADQLQSIEVMHGGTLDVNTSTPASIKAQDGATVKGSQAQDRVEIAAGAEVKYAYGISSTEGVYVFGLDGVSVTNNSGSAATYGGLDDDTMAVEADALSSSVNEQFVVNNELSVSTVTHQGEGELTLAHVNGDALSVVETDTAALILQGITATTLSELTIGGGASVGVYTDDTKATEGTVTIDAAGVLTAGDSTLRANLVMENDSALLVGGVEKALHVGSELTMGSNIALDKATLQALDSLAVGNYFWLIDAAAGSELSYTGSYGEDAWFDSVFSRFASDGDYELEGDFNIVFDSTDGFGLQKFSSVPEPTTGTLSLLALAALAARRRKH
ncbi:MAG: hypothetical protein MJ056_03125, partial [Akkermansia sp.]|nr:hypothetical protein [Akkermansia sp.]